MTDRAAPINANTYPADSFRELVQALAPVQGVVAAGDLQVSQHAGTPGMSVDVAAGAALLQGIRSTVTQGTYHFLKDAVQTYTIAAADPTNPRNDLVCAVVTDSVYAVDGTPNTQNVRVVTGTPAGTPVDPSIPATWSAYVLLARVRVNANATSIVNANITDLRPRAALLGQANLAKCRVHMAANLAAPANGSPIKFDTVDDDPNGNYATGTGLYTVPVAGFYAVDFGVEVVSTGTQNTSQYGAYQNGAQVPPSVILDQLTASRVYTFDSSGIVKCAVGDTIGVSSPNFATGTTIQGDVRYTFMHIHLMSRS